jgi:hypothetical protein
MRNGWYRDSYRHSLAARGIKTNFARKLPVEKTVMYLYEDEMGLPRVQDTQVEDIFALRRMGGNRIDMPPALRVLATSGTAPSGYINRGPDQYPIPEHSQSLSPEQRFLRKAAKEHQKKVVDLLPEYRIEEAMENMFGGDTYDDRAKVAFGQKKYVRIIPDSGNHIPKVIGPFKSFKEAEMAKQEFLDSVEKEKERMKELMGADWWRKDRIGTRPHLSHEIPEVHYPASRIDIMSQKDFNKWTGDEDSEYGTDYSMTDETEYEKLFPFRDGEY